MNLAHREIELERLEGLVTALEKKIRFLEGLYHREKIYSPVLDKIEKEIIHWKNHKNF